MKTIGLILLVAYLIIMWHLFPNGRKSLDVFKLNPVLLPSWWKLVGLGWLTFVIVYSIMEGNLNPTTNTFLLTGLYFGLLLITFSKEKNEDEFSAQIRIKAMYISIITLFFAVGMLSCLSIATPASFKDFPIQILIMMFNSVLIVYLAYFYWTKYGFKRKRYEK